MRTNRKILTIMRAFESEDRDDYTGSHQAPINNGYNVPLFNVSTFFPGIYTETVQQALRHYGQDLEGELECLLIIRQAYNRPDMRVTIYRAVPKQYSEREKMKTRLLELQKEKTMIQKTSKLPRSAGDIDKTAYYNQLVSDIADLTNLLNETPEDVVKQFTINKGDWVTLSRAYAKMHGASWLHDDFIIVKKVVPAMHVFTDANALTEFGYDPTGTADWHATDE